MGYLGILCAILPFFSCKSKAILKTKVYCKKEKKGRLRPPPRLAEASIAPPFPKVPEFPLNHLFP